MSLRTVIRSPAGEPVVRDVVDGKWAEPSGTTATKVGEDWWALPGLVDAHAHLPAAELNPESGDFDGAVVRAREALEAGVTLILDKGWTDDVTIRVIDALPRENRPDIEAAARIIASPGGYYPDFGIEVDPDDIASTVEMAAGEGRGWVKLIGDWPRRGVGPMANFTESGLADAVSTASRLGAKVAIHTMAPDVPSLAVSAGVHSIEHGLFLDDDDVSVLGGRGGMWVPTVLRIEATLAQLGRESSGGKLLAEGLTRVRRLLPLALEAGVHVLAGTDLVGSPAEVSAEAIRLGEYGLSNEEVVHAVSRAAFRATGRDDSFTVGSEANAVFFPADPRLDVGVLGHPVAVMRLGRLL